MKSFKIQVISMGGWSDLKSSIDGEKYLTETYKTKKEAMAEIHSFVEDTDSIMEDYRVVDSNIPEDFDLYE
jgi:hypothetical protein